MAEAIFNHKVKKRGLIEKFQADSAGTAGYHIGSPPDHRTIQVLRNQEIRVFHSGRQLHERDGIDFDYIIGLDRHNYENIKTLLPDHKGVHLMREFDASGKNKDVPDPYYGDISDFEGVYEILSRSIDSFIDYLSERHK